MNISNINWEQVWQEQQVNFVSTILKNEFIPQRPFPNQVKFLIYPSEESFYGGQAGGGKSSALLMGALQYVEEKHIPPDENKLEYNSLIIRRTLEDLDMPNAIMDRAKQWLFPLEDEGLVKWREQKKRFIFSSGATLTFRYLHHDTHLNSYQGAEFQYIAFDELTQFTKKQYSYLHSRLRKTEDNPVPLRIRSASNPGGIGHDWVKKRFVSDKSRLAYIPSSYLDNIYLDQEDYSKQLDKLDSVTKAQLKYGDWEAQLTKGLLCDKNTLEKQLINHEIYNEWIPSFCTIGVDPASTGSDKLAMACLVYFTNGCTVLVDLDSTPASNPESQLYNFIMDNLKWKPYCINFEREPASSPEYALKYWVGVLESVTLPNGIIVTDTPSSKTGSKYLRAVPHATLVRQGKLYFDESLFSKRNYEDYNSLRNLFNQYVYVHPNKSIMNEHPSPDELDSVSYAHIALSEVLSAGVTAY